MSPNKKRKLKYIREKNEIISGGRTITSTLKFSFEMKLDTDFIDTLIKSEIERTIKKLSAKYKIAFKYLHKKAGTVSDDFSKNLFTIALFFSKA